VSGRATTPTVERRYVPSPDLCTRALELLLKKSSSTKGGPDNRPEDAERSSSGIGATASIPEGT
jgi:hypothetical protein